MTHPVIQNRRDIAMKTTLSLTENVSSANPTWVGEAPSASRTETPPVWQSKKLLRGQKTVAIEHNGALYRLQSTRAGKLILTK